MPKFRMGHNNASKKIPDSEIETILTRRANGESYARISRDYDVIPLTIARICNGESRRAITKGLVAEELIEFNIDAIDPEAARKAEEAFRQMAVEHPSPRIDAAQLFLQSRDPSLEIDRRSDMIDKQEIPNDRRPILADAREEHSRDQPSVQGNSSPIVQPREEDREADRKESGDSVTGPQPPE